jgi:glutamate dehydrogenase (NAD(P)+)
MSTTLATKAPLIAITWTDPVTGRNGYVVIDELVRGVCSGGLRMRAGCTLDEVRDLARGMTVKEMLHYDPEAKYIPLGGGKGGVDCDPRDPDAPAMLRRFIEATRPVIEHLWTTGEDLGLTQDLIDETTGRLGMQSSIQAVYPLLDDEVGSRERLAKAFEVDVNGVSLDSLVGGCGVAESVLAALDADGTPYAGQRVVVQGFGTMGGATARFLVEAGLVLVAVADVDGVIANPDGLDVELLLRSRTPLGAIDRTALRPEDRLLPADAWLDVETDVLVPAAVSYSITAANAATVTARYVAEAANVPVLPEAERLLAERGVVVLPDVVVNSGTNAWWWWTLFGDIDADAEQAFAKVRSSMRSLVTQMLARAAADGTLPRAAALAIADERLPQLIDKFGRHR